jgi:phytoene synthase
MPVRIFRNRRPRMLAPSRILRPPPRQVGGGRWREDLVDEARQAIRGGSRTLSFASRLLDKGSRERAWLLYAWHHRCHAIAASGPPQEHLDEAPEDDPRIKGIRVLTRRALEGEPTADPAFDALGQVAMEAGIDEQLIDDAIEGFALKAGPWQPHSEADLMRYCYHAGGAPAVMAARAMGVPADEDEMLDRACDFGLAFALVSLVRDLCEDDAAERCHLPAEWLAEVDIPPGEHLKPAYREPLLALVGRLLDMAEQHEAMGRLGADAFPLRQRWAVMTAANLFLILAARLRGRGARAWDRRVRIGPLDKLRAAAKAGFEALDRPAEPFARPTWNRGQILIAVRMAGPIPPIPMTPLPDEGIA